MNEIHNTPLCYVRHCNSENHLGGEFKRLVPLVEEHVRHRRLDTAIGAALNVGVGRTVPAETREATVA